MNDREKVAMLVEALLEIAKGQGPFSRDPLTHCGNTVEAMKKLAQNAIAKAQVLEGMV